ncbi:MAG: AraC family transcriptional regulator [Planctomycetota bacterium]|nr:AraC family transcriptional regulator [Planctomycetota bacterium]
MRRSRARGKPKSGPSKSRMEEDIFGILREQVLPALERFPPERVVMAQEGGKRSFAPFPLPAKLDDALGDRPRSPGSFGDYSASAILEFAFGLGGKAMLGMEGRSYAVDAGDIAVIPAGIKHQERIMPGVDPYRLLWMRCSVGRISLHVSSFERATGFHLIRYARLNPGGKIALVLERAAEAAAERGDQWHRLFRARFEEGMILILRHLDAHGVGQSEQAHRENVVEFAKAFIQTHFAHDLSVAGIAGEVFLSPNYFTSLFTKSVGLTPVQYMQQVRLEAAQRLLQDSDLPIHEIARRVGLASSTYLSRLLRRETGRSARELRRAD